MPYEPEPPRRAVMPRASAWTCSTMARRVGTSSPTVGSSSSSSCGRRLKNDAHAGQRLQKILPQPDSVDRDRPRRAFEQPRDQGEQRRLAGPVRAQQHLESSGGDIEADMAKRRLGVVMEAEPENLQGGAFGRIGLGIACGFAHGPPWRWIKDKDAGRHEVRTGLPGKIP